MRPGRGRWLGLTRTKPERYSSRAKTWGGSVQYYGRAAKQARETANAAQRENEDAVQKRMRELGIPRALAVYLLEVETKIAQLDQTKR